MTEEQDSVEPQGFTQERREYKRGEVDFVASCYTGSTTSIELVVDTSNLCEGGMNLLVPRELIPGGQLVVVFYLPNSETRRKINDLKKMNIRPKSKNYGKDRIELEAEVVWCQSSIKRAEWFDTGIKFMFMDDIQRKIIREFLEKHERGLL